MEIDMTAEARILASGFEKGMTAFGESIERGLKAMAEAMAQTGQPIERRTLSEAYCLNHDFHLPHEWTLRRGLVSEEAYCPGKP